MEKESKSNVEARLLMTMFFYEYIDYIYVTKGKDFSEKLQNRLEKDSELSTKEWMTKYKRLWLKIKSDTDFDKYLEEKPLETCECGSADVKCIGLGGFDKEIDIQMYKWHCFTCNKDFESSINEKGENYEHGKKRDI